MLNNYMKYIISIIVIITLLIPQKFSSIEGKLSNEQKQILSQAKALENSGLVDEAIIAYKDILKKTPTFKIAFEQLKRIYIKTGNLKELIKIADQYVKSNNYSIISEIDILDVYIITENQKWKDIINKLYNTKPTNLNNIKRILPILLEYNKVSNAYDLIKLIRSETKNKGFYALEFGNFFTLKLDFDNALNEYLVYISEKPKSLQFITQKIMSLADHNIAIDSIKNKLLASPIRESKIILSALEFKLKNYNQSYQLLDSINNSDKEKLQLAKDLIKMNQFNLAETIITNIIHSSKDKMLINKAIFQLGSLYEIQAGNSIVILPISNDIYKNELLNSPYIKFNDEYKNLLFKAISIYDSLSTYNNDYNSSLHLAEIKYKVIEDLDGAEKIYYDIYYNHNSIEHKARSLSNIIEINLSKGNIDYAMSIIDSMYHQNLPKEILEVLDIKKIQTYFYHMNRDSLIYHSNELLKSLPKDHRIYNDILDILNLFYSYEDNEITEYVQAKYQIIQNKKNNAIDILDSVDKSNRLYHLVQFESIYLETIEGNYQEA